MTIRFATLQDFQTLLRYEKHIRESELKHAITQNRIFLAENEDRCCAWLRYGLFWDNTPFMNMLYVLEQERGKGYGKALVTHWENEMRQLCYPVVMTSTLAEEYAQHFYMNLGYRAAGGFFPYQEGYEIIMTKKL